MNKWRCLDSLSNSLLRRLASSAYLEDLDDGVTRNHPLYLFTVISGISNSFEIIFIGIIVYRQGDRGTNWYFILSGEVVMTTTSGNKTESASNHVSPRSIYLTRAPYVYANAESLSRRVVVVVVVERGDLLADEDVE